MRRILCFGDSNTYGYAPDGQRYEADSIWPGIMGKLLGDRFEVVADGKNGRTIAFDDPYMEGCNGMLDIDATIFCEKETHKRIIIGKNGSMLKKISTFARQDIERFFDCRVFLQTWVKVKEDWRNRAQILQNFGYDEKNFD